MPIADVPRLGLGTADRDPGPEWVETVSTALEAGYRHVDTAQVYGTEEYVGRAIEESDVPREDVFVATKTVHHDVPGPEYEDVIDAVEGCLDRLGLEYVDLLYVHWPTGVYDPDVTLPAFDELHGAGKTRHVGLSNFTPDLLDEARDRLDAPVLAHQVEMHPYLQQEELHAYAREHEHWLVAYSPLGNGRVLDDPVLQSVAETYDATAAQVALAWLLEKDDVVAIPKATSPDHQRANLAALDLDLDEADVARIDGIDREERFVDPENAAWNR